MISKFLSLFLKNVPLIQVTYIKYWNNFYPPKKETLTFFLTQNKLGYRDYKVFVSNYCKENKGTEAFDSGFHMWKNSVGNYRDIDWGKFFPNCTITFVYGNEMPKFVTESFQFK